MDVQHFKIVLTTPDAERLVTFYRDIVGLTPAPARGSGEFDIAGASMLVQPHSETTGPSRDPVRFLITLFVADAVAEQRRLQAAGVTFSRPASREPWGGLVATFSDPDGNLCQLLQVRAG